MLYWIIIKWPRKGGMRFLRTYPKTRAGLGNTEAWIPGGKMLAEHTLIAQETREGEAIILGTPDHGTFLEPELNVSSFLLFTKGGPESVAVSAFLEVGIEGMGWERDICRGVFLL